MGRLGRAGDGQGRLVQTGGGGSGTPGGSTTQFQYNNAGAFGGTSGFTWDGTNALLTAAQELRFRDANCAIWSNAASILHIKGVTRVRIRSGETVMMDETATNTIASFTHIGSAVNYLLFNNSATTSPLLISAIGTDTNIDIKLVPKGSGIVESTGKVKATQVESTIAIGTAPLIVTSTTKVTNLNADLLDDKNTGTSGNTIPLLDGANTWSGTQTLGTTTKLQFLDATSFIQATSAGNVTLEAAALLTLGVAGTTEFGDGTLRTVRPQTDLKIDLGDGTHRFNDCYFSTESLKGKTVKYNDIATVGNGIPSIYAEINSTGLTANVAATDLLAAGSVVAGRYRITAYLVTTTAASVSSTMPNAQIVYTDSDSNTAVTLDVSPILGAAGLGQSGLLTANAVGTVFTGSVLIYAKVGVAIQYQTVNYASTAAGMAYALRITLERL